MVAILIWVVLNKTTFGYELKAVGPEQGAARYAGINEKKNIILSMAIAGALAGFGAGLFYLSNVGQWNPELHQPARHGLQRHLRCPAGKLNPIGTIFSALFISHLGGRHLPFHQVLSTEIAGLISGIIIYLCILHAVPRQDPEACCSRMRTRPMKCTERRACPGGKGQREGGQVRCCF